MYPSLMLFGGGYTPNFSTPFTLDAANEEAALIFKAPFTGNITAVGWRTGTVTTGATLDVRLENVSLVNGDPNDTLVGTNTNGSQVVADTDDNKWFLTPLTAAASVTRGQLMALTIVNPAASFGNMIISNFADSVTTFPYGDLFAGAGPAWGKLSVIIVVALSYSGVYYPIEGCFPFSGIPTYTYNSGTAAQDEIALKFKLPSPSRIIGGWVWVDADGDFDIVLYDSDGTTVLATTSLDTNVRSEAEANLHYFTFPSAVNLTKDVFYYLSVKPTTVTSLTAYAFDVDSAAVMDACIGGQNIHFASRVDAGAWTAVTTRRPFFCLLLDAFDDGVGGGGGGMPILRGSVVRG